MAKITFETKEVELIYNSHENPIFNVNFHVVSKQGDNIFSLNSWRPNESEEKILAGLHKWPAKSNPKLKGIHIVGYLGGSQDKPLK